MKMLKNVPVRYRHFRAMSALVAVLVLGFAAAAAITSWEGKGFVRVKVVGQTTAATTNSTTWIDVPGAIATFSVSSSLENLFIARFAAESACYGSTGFCNVRILANGIEMAPVVGTDYAFDSTGNGAEPIASWEGHAMERSLPLCGSFSTVTVKVQYKVSNAAATFRLDDWHLTAEQFSTGGSCVP
jgi:hypothetical protein